MSIITLNYGQCGNQIGHLLYQRILEDVHSDKPNQSQSKLNIEYGKEAIDKWFHVTKKQNLEARTILIDTEDKVTSFVKHTKDYRYPNVLSKPRGGSANNWAFGYTHQSESILDETMEAIRKEMEKCDFLSCFLNILSSAGGTGSGVGSKILEMLQDEHSNKIIVTAIIFPYSSGEVATQNYNNVLSLSKIYPANDAILLFNNDRLNYICSTNLNIENVKFDDLNSVITDQLMAIAQPIEGVDIPGIVSQLACHPSYKFILPQSAPMYKQEYYKFETDMQWSSILNMFSKFNRFRYKFPSKLDIYRSLGSICITRGSHKPTDNDTKQLHNSVNYVPWVPVESRLTCFHQSRCLNRYKKFATVLSNSQDCALPIDAILEDGWSLFTSGAFLHHYQKFGIDEQYFLEAFEVVESIIQEYTVL